MGAMVVGRRDGARVGSLVGTEEGVKEGIEVGLEDGVGVGSPVGVRDGTDEGRNVGLSVTAIASASINPPVKEEISFNLFCIVEKNTPFPIA